MPDLEQRVAAMEARWEKFRQAQPAVQSYDIMKDAMLRAVCSVLQELVEREGVSQQEFDEHMDRRFRWWHDYCLRMAEDVAPDLAARTDNRTLADADVPPSYPPLFPAPPPEDS